MKKQLLAIFLLIGSFYSIQAKEVPTAGAMMFDAVAIRPLGMASVVVGSTVFIVSSPFSLFTPSPVSTLNQTFSRLVVYPIRFTFSRNMGDFPGYMEEIEYVQE